MARIYQAATLNEATVRVVMVAQRSDADLLVHRVSSMGLAHGDALWFITRNKADATTLAYFCSASMAQLKIHFVDTRTEAGWQKSHPLKGKLG